jgi:GxxExxY protein
MEVHRNLGKGFLEIVYKDALEYEFTLNNLYYEREKEYLVNYKNSIILQHKFFADFVIDNKIILEVKAMNGLADEHLAQTINYLKVSGCKLGILVNFGKLSLQYKRLIV